jgi:hypothetical protein
MSDLSFEELDQLRCRIVDRIALASETLEWFAEQFTGDYGIPRNTWRMKDRPHPDKVKAIGPAFDVWHSLLRAERVLRIQDPKRATNVLKTIHRLHNNLEDVLSSIQVQHNGATLLPRLVGDEVYGTANALTAASILRSEVFPERSKATPSYLAGHILFAELRIANKEATAHRLTGIRERAPRLGIVAQAVHSSMLYVEHLRRRKSLFLQTGEQIEDLLAWWPNLDRPVLEALTDDQVRFAGRDGHLRLASARLGTTCFDCGSLVLATKPFFDSLGDALVALSDSDDPVDRQRLAKVIRDACKTRGDSTESQEQIHAHSVDIAVKLSRTLTGIVDALSAVLMATDDHTLSMDLRRLTTHLAKLLAYHTKGLDESGRFPSIRDSARYQLAVDLTTSLTSLDTANDLLKAYDLRSDCTTTSAAAAIFGKSKPGSNLLSWWKVYAECYFLPRKPDQEDFWLFLRQAAFEHVLVLKEVIDRVADSAEQSEKASEDSQVWISAQLPRLSEALNACAGCLSDVADRIESLIKTTTQWCRARGHQLLVARYGGSPHGTDPHELIAALWIADRLGESWPERLESEALDLISSLQFDDGSFPAVEPVYQNRGFAFYWPTATTISLLAQFVVGRGLGVSTTAGQNRLRRWQSVIVRGSHFLLNTMVGLEGSDRAGWYSDRFPEPDRLDRLSTADGVTALCRLEEAFRWLVNLEAMKGLMVQWPNRQMATAKPLDCRLGCDQLLLEGIRLTRGLDRRTARYASSRRAQVKPNVASSLLHSVMFYGPPGTGKTYFQTVIAGELEWPLVTVTMGSFVSSGADQVGRRAVEVFGRLRRLSNTCIVFDEFDEMIADRNPTSAGEVYPAKTRTGFNILTATMLPLLDELRQQAETRSCLVSFTTNYFEHIDAAARRGGRIDRDILVLYPDYASRVLMLLTAAKDRGVPMETIRSWSDDVIRKTASLPAGCPYMDVMIFFNAVLDSCEVDAIEADGQVDGTKVMLSGDPRGDYASFRPRPAIDAEYYLRRCSSSPNRTDPEALIDEIMKLIDSVRTFVKEARDMHDTPEGVPAAWRGLVQKVRGLPPPR